MQNNKLKTEDFEVSGKNPSNFHQEKNTGRSQKAYETKDRPRI